MACHYYLEIRLQQITVIKIMEFIRQLIVELKLNFDLMPIIIIASTFTRSVTSRPTVAFRTIAVVKPEQQQQLMLMLVAVAASSTIITTAFAAAITGQPPTTTIASSCWSSPDSAWME